MSGLTIRPERPGDSAAIHGLTKAAFRDAPHSSGTEAAIVDALREAGALTLSLVALEAGALVGHVAFSPVAIDGRSCGWFGLGPVSVRPDRQRRGIGTDLITDGLDRLRGMPAAGCVLVGDPEYYGRFGFASDPRLRYGDVPQIYVLRLAFAAEVATGVLTYHPAFDVS